MLPRRFNILFGSILLFLIFVIIFSGSPQALPTGNDGSAKSRGGGYKAALPKFAVPNLLNPFRPQAHKPPVQANSTSGEAKWYSDWKWLHPFSSSITLDENRAVLPPLKQRPPIYTYYDASVSKSADVRDAERRLINLWRRAWWAQGFRPIVLGRAEAMNNPLYERMQGKQLESTLESEIMRWMAWGHMGTGILSNWLAVPMGSSEDNLLSYLRRGEYPLLTRYENLGSGFFSGNKDAINKALETLLQRDKLDEYKTIIDALGSSSFEVDPQPEAIAFYDTSAISMKYNKVADKLFNTQSTGLQWLARLMNAHLHNTFRSNFEKGIAVLKPLPEHTTALVSPALRIATLLSQCPDTPMPTSCPPNNPKCHPCIAAYPIQVTTPQYFRNNSKIYTIGTVPHPYTLATLVASRQDIDTRHIRRHTERDIWILAVTKELLGTGIGAPPRVSRLKEAIAGDYGTSRSLWLTAEYDTQSRSLWLDKKSDVEALTDDMLVELDWHFGFQLSRNKTSRGESATPVPGPESQPAALEVNRDDVPEKEFVIETDILAKAGEALRDKEGHVIGIVKVVEAWNLADTEAWRFARAYLARARVERLKWEEEERKFDGGGRGIWSRLLDRVR